MKTVLKRMLGRESRIAMIGLGYAELPLAMAFARASFQTIGMDIDQSKIDQIIEGKTCLLDVAGEEIWISVQAGLLSAKSDYNALPEVDAVFICVPIPTMHNTSSISASSAMLARQSCYTPEMI